MHLDPVEEPTGGEPLPDVDAAVARALDQRYDLARARNDLGNAGTNVELSLTASRNSGSACWNRLPV